MVEAEPDARRDLAGPRGGDTAGRVLAGDSVFQRHFQVQLHQSAGKEIALRISRVVSETLRLEWGDVRWFVMGDDDTVFFVENLVRVLSKYDHRQMYYLGSSSESHIQNIFFSYSMAYGGGGFAISYPLAKELEKMQDRCIQRYPSLYGSDDRIQACMAELGVPLTKEVGFHQVIHNQLFNPAKLKKKKKREKLAST